MPNTVLAQKLAPIGKTFKLPGTLVNCTVLTAGNVNSTYKMDYLQADGTEKSYVAQRINPYVFHYPVEVMKNIDLVTTHIRKKNPHGNTLHFHHTASGENYFRDKEDDALWRLYTYIPAVSFNNDSDLTVLRNAGAAFGEFQMQLSDFDASLLFETIPNFHNTRIRLASLFTDAKADPYGRAGGIRAELAYIASVQPLAVRLTEAVEAGKIPLRVTHNDTKINNVLFHPKTKQPLAVIDLDTVMPGLVMHDFGDAVRFGASTAAEDEEDLSLVGLDLRRYRAFAEGFIGKTREALTPCEIESMALGAVTITIELAARFLDDYLLGDKYFKVSYEGHNRVRAACQIRLARDMLKKYDTMCKIIRDLTKE